MKRVIDMTDDELRALIREENQRARPREPERRYYTCPQASKKYGIGRVALKKLIETGQLPALSRPLPGGKGWVIAADDAERVLNTKQVLRVVG